MKMIRIEVYEFTQFKAAQITAKVDYVDYSNNQLLQTFPIASEFVLKMFIPLTEATEGQLRKPITLISAEKRFLFLLMNKWFLIREKT